MKKLIKPLLNDKFTFWGFFISLLAFLTSLIYTAIFYQSLPPFMPLYNKLPWGFARLGTKPEIFIPITITFLFYLGNFFLAMHIYPKSPLLGRILALVNLLVCLLTAIFVWKIITLIL